MEAQKGSTTSTTNYMLRCGRSAFGHIRIVAGLGSQHGLGV